MAATWKLYGYDSFAREEYLIGEYATAARAQEEAEKQRRILEQTQDEPLRDTIWIAPPTSDDARNS